MNEIQKLQWDSFQAEIGTWADDTFRQSSPSTILAHFKREVKELLDEADDTRQPGEIADCVMLLMHLCHKQKLSLYDELRHKFEICKGRKWGKPDADGVVEHVRE